MPGFSTVTNAAAPALAVAGAFTQALEAVTGFCPADARTGAAINAHAVTIAINWKCMRQYLRAPETIPPIPEAPEALRHPRHLRPLRHLTCAPRPWTGGGGGGYCHHMTSRTVVLLLTVGWVGCSSEPSRPAAPPATAAPAAATAPVEPPANRKYLLERVDDAAVVQLYADGFAALPLKEKTLIWHLYEAALAGRDIFIDQKHRSALEMRGILEQIVAHPQGVDPATLAEIQRYTKLFWINNGPYNNLTARKFVLKCTPQAFAAAAKASAQTGRRSRRSRANRSTRC